MKKLLLILSCFIAISAFAQPRPLDVLGSPRANVMAGAKIKTYLGLPVVDSLKTPLQLGLPDSIGAVCMLRSNKNIYKYNGAGVWEVLGSGTSSISYIFNNDTTVYILDSIVNSNFPAPGFQDVILNNPYTNKALSVYVDSSISFIGKGAGAASTTELGVLVQPGAITAGVATNLGIRNVRVAYNMDNPTYQYRTQSNNGFGDLVTINWQSTSNGTRTFPTSSQLATYAANLRALCHDLKNYNIIHIFLENEPGNLSYGQPNALDCIKEYSTASKIIHDSLPNATFSDGGFEGAGLHYLVYNYLNTHSRTADATTYKNLKIGTGVNMTSYASVHAREIGFYDSLSKGIDTMAYMTYINHHDYEPTLDSTLTAADTRPLIWQGDVLTFITGDSAICGEYGQYNHAVNIVPQMTAALVARGRKLAVVFSGDGSGTAGNTAVALHNSNDNSLRSNGSAMAVYIAGLSAADTTKKYYVGIGNGLYLPQLLSVPVLGTDATGKIVVGTAGGGSGVTNSNIGTGYRLAIPNTNNVKTLFSNTFILHDSTTNANGITTRLDTSGLRTYLNGFYQPIGSYLTGNQSITLSGDASGSGTTGIATTITGLRGAALPSLSTGNLRYNGSAWVMDNTGIDSSVFSTNYRRDSLAAHLRDSLSRKNFKLGWYDVVSYGADTTGTTDATTAIQSAINDAAAHGGGTVYFRKGTYKIAGAYKTTDGNGHTMSAAQLYIPFSSFTSTSTLLSIKLLGESPPNEYANFGDSIAQPKNGVILKSTANDAGSIIGSPYASSAFGNFSATQLEMENLTVRARSKTAGGTDTSNIQTGINAYNISMLRLHNVRVDNESIDSASAQPTSGTYGVRLPALSNFAVVHLTNVNVSGYYTGIQTNEHLEADGVMISTCYNGMEFTTSFHAVNCTKLLVVWCVNNLLISGTTYATIANLDVEDYPGTGTGNYASRWFNNLRDIYEPSLTNSYFNIYFHRVTSGVGSSDAGFITSVLSTNIIYSQIGKPFSKFFQDLTVNSAATGVDYTGTFNTAAQYNGLQINTTSTNNAAQSFVGLAKNGTNVFQLASNVNQKGFGVYDNRTSTWRYYIDSFGTISMGDGANTVYPTPATYPFVLKNKSVGVNVLSPGATLDINSSGNHTASGVDTIAKFTSATQYPIVVFNGTNSNSGTQLIFQKNGVNTFQFGNDFSANGTKDFFVYDATNLKVKLYVSNAGIVQLGNTANSSPNLTIADGAAGSVTTAGKLIAGGTVRLKGYTVATLPTGTVGDMAYVTDASSPVWNTTVAGGGSSIVTVFYNGTNWTVH